MNKPLFFILLLSGLIQGCASSKVSEGAASEGDRAYLSTNYTLTHLSIGDMSDTYQNTSQTKKGVLIGGTAGALAGGLSSGIGVLPGLAEGALFGGAIGAYIDANTTLKDQLANRGVKVFVLGDQVMLVLASSRTFDGMSANLKSSSYSTLDMIVELINRYPNMSVKIASYTGITMGSKEVSIALSKQQAESVQKYLWRAGVNTRLLYAEGYGCAKQVTKDDSMEWGENDNFRVEITLESLPV